MAKLQQSYVYWVKKAVGALDAAISSTKDISTAANISTTNSGTITSDGPLTATGGYVGTGMTRIGVVDGVIEADTGTDTTYVAGDKFVTEIVIPYNVTLTGAAILNGPTVGTDKVNVALFDSSGQLVANSDTAGTTTSGADSWQEVAFTDTYDATSGRYFVAVQGNGTTDNFHTLSAGGLNSTVQNTDDNGSFGTLSNISSPPTTFTADVGPIMYLY